MQKYISIIMLFIAVGFNLWTYRLEPTAKIDPNDNPFQYALVERTHEIWEYAAGVCGINILCFSGYLIDHWVPNWAQGYNLPHYYSHIPQIAIVASYKFLSVLNFQPSALSLFEYYHVVIYLLLCLFPISVFVAFRVLKTPPVITGAAALLASHISTDGLYGLDPPSFLWRGYGLTSQLFAMIWMPIAIACAYRYFYSSPFISHHFSKTVIFLVLTISGHLGLGVITLLSVGILAVSKPILDLFHKESIITIVDHTRKQFIKLLAASATSVLFLSYWIVPALLEDKYHNYSFWDPVWKFNSWGWREVMQLFFNGALFDFGRGFPVLTVLLIIGGFAVLYENKKESKNLQPPATYKAFYPFSFLFLFWLLLFFGRSTWGSLLDIIPSMKEFHQSRFIVGLHLAGFFLAPFGLWFLTEHVPRWMLKIQDIFSRGLSSLKTTQSHAVSPVLLFSVSITLISLTVLAAYPQTIRYASHNDVLIKQGNENFNRQNPDVEELITTLQHAPPGRTFTGRGGSWGKKLQIAETTYFMHLSTYGIPVILWLPQTWSPNSDVEQFFVEEWKEHYELMNVKYVVTPPDHTPLEFWKFMKETPQWKLYEVETSGYFGTGSHAAVVYTSKFHYINLVRQWLQSDYVKQNIFPQLTFNRSEMINSPIPAFEMIDEATYRTRDGNIFGLFGDIPRYEAAQANLTISKESSKADMEFKATVTAGNPCERCLVFLKQSFHPNWRAWINGKPVNTFISFPFYTAVSLTSPGTHTVEFKYQPGTLKMMLFSLSVVTFILCIIVILRKKFVKTSS